MGKTLSFIHLRSGLSPDSGSFFARTVLIFILSFTFFSCQSLAPLEKNVSAFPANQPTEASTEKPLPLLQKVNLSDPKMAWVSPGYFIMGTDAVDSEKQGLQLGFPQAWYEDEQPSHRVELPGFYIDRHEVTQGEYLIFMRKTGRRPPPHWRHGEYKVGTKELPITFVDWHDANDYCRWHGKKLPSEAQWEKAARGPDAHLYPWGNSFDVKHAHLSATSDAAMKLSPVGAYPSGVSPYGVFDLVGNAWEWTDSWYLAYPGASLRKPEFGMKHRVVRGLSFNTLGHYPIGAYPRVLEVYARAGTRSYDPPSEKLEDLGFRCAKQGPKP